jgi:vacuolar-type H+-ATPase subunit H
MILRERGQNQKLAQEILEKLSPESKERLFRIFQDKENEINAIKRKAKTTPWALM